MSKKVSFGLIIFLLIPFIVIYFSDFEIDITDSTKFTFSDEQGLPYDGEIKFKDITLEIKNGEVIINNSYIYYFDVSDNLLKSKGDAYAYISRDNLSLSYTVFIDDNTSNFNEIPIIISEDDFKIEKYNQFRYNSANINYKYDSECNWVQKTNLEKAFEELSDSTILNFKESENDIKLHINCFDYNNINDEGNYILGEGSPSYYNNQTKEIINGTMNFYKQTEAKRCIKYPSTEIHEILHSLNFGHIENKNSIMHPGVGGNLCNELSEEFIDCINSIYSNSELNCKDITFIIN